MTEKNLKEQMARLRVACEQLDEAGRMLREGEVLHQKSLVMLQQARYDHIGAIGDAEHSTLVALGGTAQDDAEATSRALDVAQICEQIGSPANGIRHGSVVVLSVWPARKGDRPGEAPKDESRRVQLIAHGPDPMPLRVYRLGEDGVWRFEQQIDHSVKSLEASDGQPIPDGGELQVSNE